MSSATLLLGSRVVPVLCSIGSSVVNASLLAAIFFLGAVGFSPFMRYTGVVTVPSLLGAILFDMSEGVAPEVLPYLRFCIVGFNVENLGLEYNPSSARLLSSDYAAYI